MSFVVVVLTFINIDSLSFCCHLRCSRPGICSRRESSRDGTLTRTRAEDCLWLGGAQPCTVWPEGVLPFYRAHMWNNPPITGGPWWSHDQQCAWRGNRQVFNGKVFSSKRQDCWWAMFNRGSGTFPVAFATTRYCGRLCSGSFRDQPVDINLNKQNILSHLVSPNPKIWFGTTADTFTKFCSVLNQNKWSIYIDIFRL